MDELLQQIETMISRLHAGEARKSEVISVLENVKAHLATQPGAGMDPVARAVSTLSYSKCQAVKALVSELPDDGGLVVATKVADSVGIARSVLVGAVRKLQSAGVVDAKSLGMKGTHIRPLVVEWRQRLQAAVA